MGRWARPLGELYRRGATPPLPIPWTKVEQDQLVGNLRQTKLDIFINNSKLHQQFEVYVRTHPNLWPDLRASDGTAAFHAFLHKYCPQEYIGWENVSHLLDWRNPGKKLPRHSCRAWFLHLGPTNSGKTRHALECLRNAQTGIYMAPLRLLAYEAFYRMKRMGLRAALWTGQERLGPADATHIAVTTEMTPTDRFFEVGVLDECHLLSDVQRGTAWTRAAMSVQCVDIHLCGLDTPGLDELLERVCNACGDVLAPAKRYVRLSPLQVDEHPVDSWDDLRERDCLVCFSRRGILRAKHQIESAGFTVACVYGSLPPATRRKQAARFQDGDAHILIASDCIAMGLNLDIDRVVFQTLQKYDGRTVRPLRPLEIRQLAGRAGRGLSKSGLVACRLAQDVPLLKEALAGSLMEDEEPLRAAVGPCIDDLTSVIHELESNAEKQLPVAEVLRRVPDMMQTDGAFFAASLEVEARAAEILDFIRLPPRDKLTFCQAPVGDNVVVQQAFRAFALQFYASHTMALPEEYDFHDREVPVPSTHRDLFLLENIYAVCDLFMWLDQRFFNSCRDREHAETTMEKLSEAIDLALCRRFDPNDIVQIEDEDEKDEVFLERG
eukprot:GEMP01017958.1.p1 GENE.GEMP01017958.1~~GEMP01017958.1.p1  ORF type:complete len:608 (+),score=163.08 GEMP01017958.1:87-1910(+)